MNKKVKKGLECTSRTGAWVAEKAVSELALPAAIISTTQSGNYLERVAHGYTSAFNVISEGVMAYVHNSGVRDVINGLGLDVIKAMGHSAENIQDDPKKVLYAALATYGLGKAVPYASKSMRKFLRNRKQKTSQLENDVQGSEVLMQKA